MIDIWVRIGNEHAIQTFPDGRIEPLPGRKITSLTIPDDRTVEQAVSESVSAMKKWIKDGERPSWIDSSNVDVRQRLIDHFKLPAHRAGEPEDWEGGE